MSQLVLTLGTEQVCMFEPIPAPRMTKSAAWSTDPGVLRYKAFCKELRRREMTLPVPFCVEFYIGMPESWSQRERADMYLLPHCSKPDCDNLVKGLIDAVFYKKKRGDSHVWAFAASMRWDVESHFIVWPVLEWTMVP